MTKTSPITGLPIEDYSISKPPLWRRLNWTKIVPLFLILFLIGKYLLDNTGLTPEGRVLQAISQTANAVEQKDRALLAEVLSDDYSDKSGLDKQGLLNLAEDFFSSRSTLEIIRVSSSVDFPEDGKAIGKVRFEVIGSVGGNLYRGFRRSSPAGESITYRLRDERGSWKIVAIDPDFGSWN